MARARFTGAARRWRYLAWGGALLLVLAAGCMLKKPQVPKSKFKISIPVADDRTLMSNVVGDRDYLELDETGRMALDFTHTFGKNGRQEIGDRLSIQPKGADFTTPIGDIELPGAELPATTIPISQLVPGASAGITAPVPATAITTQVPLTVENIVLVVVKEGAIDITFRNNLPLDLTNMRLILADRGAEVSTIDLGQVPAGSSESGSFALAGKSISGNLAIQVTGSTVAADAATVTNESALEVRAALQPLIATQAEALIPQQEFEDRQALEFPDDRIQVTTALIRKGRLTFEVTNNIPLVMQLDIALDDLKKPDGKPPVFRIQRLNENEVVTAVFDVEGTTFAPIDPLKLRFSYFATTIPSTEPESLIAGTTIEVKAITDTLAFSRVEGILNRLSVPIPTTRKKLGFPDGLDNIALSTSSLQVFMTSGVGFSSELNLHLDGFSTTGDQGTLDVNAIIARGDAANPKQLILGPTSTELTNFLNVLPDSLVVEPEVLLGDGQGVEMVAPEHWVRMDSLVFKAPARLLISADTQIRTDPVERRFNDATARERISSTLDSAVVETAVENHLPIGVRVSLMVGSTRDQVFTNPILRIPREQGFGVDAAPVDSRGRVTQSLNSTQRISIRKEDALVFLQPGGVYTGILIELDRTAGGQNIDVLGTDFVDVKAFTEIFLELNDVLVNGGN